MELQVKGVSKYFGDVKAVNHVSITLEQGISGLIGANGAGKSTLMRLISGYIPPTQGEIIFDSKSIGELGESYQNILGYLPQKFGYIQDYNVMDYLQYIACNKGLSKKQYKVSVEKVIDLLSLNNVIRKRIKTLSGGMQRRVGLAQAIINDPIVLILDEPTAGLDPGEQIVFRNYISAISEKKIILISTHIVSELEMISDKNAIMKSGHVISYEKIEDLKQELDGNVYSVQMPLRKTRDMDKICVLNTTITNWATAEVRYYASPDSIIPGSKKETASLEDVYMWYYRGDNGDRR